MASREFQFTDGSSDKFWIIDLEADKFTVRFGRVGTRGQTQEKTFGTEAEAAKAYEKLIAEKVKKGYKEIGAAAATTAAPPAAAKATKAKKAARETEKTADAKAEPAVPAPSAVLISTDVVRRVHLSPGELALKTGASVKRPDPEPFDRQACLLRLARVTKGADYHYGWDWSAAEIPEVMTAEEADFWMQAILQESYRNTPRSVLKEMQNRTLATALSAHEVRDRVKTYVMRDHSIMAPIACLMSAEEIFDWIADLFEDSKKQVNDSWGYVRAVQLAIGFSLHVVPYLSAKQVQSMRKRVADSFDANVPWPDHHHPLPFEYYMAAALGMHKEVQQIVARITDTTYGKSFGWNNDHYQQPQFLVLRLGDPAVVEAEMRRIKLLLRGSSQIRSWLAVTGWSALDVVRDSILDVGKREEVERLINLFGQAIEAPEAGVTMLELKLQSKAPSVARQWLDEHLGCSIAGLIPIAAGKGKLADAALDFLREKKRQGHTDLIVKLLNSTPAEAVARVRAEVIDREEKVYPSLDDKTTPAWLTNAAADLKGGKIPDWLPTPSLPTILVGEHRLNDEQIRKVIAALQKSAFDSEHPLLAALREHADAESLDVFAWAVFDYWLSSGAPSKEKWGMTVLGFLGGDRSVLKITPLIRAWPGESQHQRAVLGLQCLRKIGSDTALMQLNGIAQKLKFKGLKESAAKYMEEIAADKGLTRAQLEDRIVPDCDLDERGSRVFDFGPRKFRFVLGPQLKPMIKDEAGAVKTDLPKPGARDDAERANQAVQEWKLLKKQVAEVAKIQSVRLEQAMVTGRRWPVADFQTMLVRHPLMINLVRLLLWAVYDDKGAIKKTFRVTEDQTCADAEDKEFKPSAAELLGVVHPLQLQEKDKSAWGEIFSDYEILPPFQQLGRPIYALEKDEDKATEIKRFANIKIPPQSLLFGLEKLGWLRGPAMDAGSFNEHVKQFPGANVTAVVTYEPGMGMGYVAEAGDQAIDHCFFVDGLQKGDWYRQVKDALKLGSVDAVVISEVLGDLTGIAAKGK